MVPIVITSDKHFDENSFKDFFLQLCKQHKKEQRALAFAFLVYDFEDHTINQILNKKEYWISLDKISGKYLSIFYVNTQDSYYIKRQQEIYEEELSQQKNNGKRFKSLLVPIYPKPTPLDNGITYIKEQFNLNENIEHPFVLFFQLDELNISEYFIVNLKQEKLEDAFIELRNHIINAVKVLLNVHPENFKNHHEIFNLIKGSVKSGKFYDCIKKNMSSKLGVTFIFALIKLIAGIK